MSDMRILSLDEFRRRRVVDSSANQPFNALFEQAREFRDIGQALVPEEIAVMTPGGMKDWFQREIADEVFQRHLFQGHILLSISFVSSVLASFASNCHAGTSIIDHLEAYTGDEKPNDILNAANTAFIMFVLWPEKRTRRSIQYRKFALDFGPSLYIMYAGCTHRDFGYHMARAFEPLGDIARERLGH